MWIESFNLVLDANNDGAISPAEAWHVFKWLYQLPGNLVIELLGNIPPVAHLLHISASADTGYGSLGGGLATVLSLLIWLLVLIQCSSLRERWKAKHSSTTAHKLADHFRRPAGKA
ncbi:hypothetical protein [Pusillimonas sp.]|uniref:hypothetical protein n=1 Tax=Pusillimonas sp. TaxID=3040095 RepID=UPI0037C9918E